MKGWVNNWLRLPVSRGLIAVVVVVGMGGAVRLVGIRHGEPEYIYHPDVPKQAWVARGIFRGGFDLSRFFHNDWRRVMYPYGDACIVGHVAGILAGSDDARSELTSQSLWKWAYWMRWAAVLSYLLAAGAVVLCLARDTGVPGALLVGLLLVFEPYAAQYSHYAMNDIPLAGMLLLCWLCSFMLFRRAGVGVLAAICAGICLGMAFGIKYQGILGGVFPACACGVMLWCREFKRTILTVFFGLAGFLCGLLATCHLLVSDPSCFVCHFSEFMQWQTNVIGLDESAGRTIVRNALWLGKFLLESHTWLLLPGMILGASACFRKAEPLHVRIAIGSALLFVCLMTLVLVLFREMMRTNDMLTIIPFMLILNGLAWTRKEVLHGRAATPVAVAALLLACVYGSCSLLDALALARIDTRARAREWCIENIPPESIVRIERYVLPMSKEGVKEWSGKYVFSDEGETPVKSGLVDYVVTSSLAHRRFGRRFSPYHDPAMVAAYRALTNVYDVAAVFRDRELEFAHPEIVVYKKK